MKKFRFSLQSVLTLRKIQQEKTLETYAEAVSRSMELHHELMNAVQRQEYLAMLIQEQREASLSASMQQAYAEALEEAEIKSKKLKESLKSAEEEKARKLSEFLQAKQKTEVMVKLRDKEENAFVQEELRNEEKELEDITIARRDVKTRIAV